MSIEGTIYDEEGPVVVDRINTFVKTYDISFEELLIQDPKGYRYVNKNSVISTKRYHPE